MEDKNCLEKTSENYGRVIVFETEDELMYAVEVEDTSGTFTTYAFRKTPEEALEEASAFTDKIISGLINGWRIVCVKNVEYKVHQGIRNTSKP